MQRKLIFDSNMLSITLGRLCQQLLESHNDFTKTAIIGLQPRGIYLADLLHKELKSLVKGKILLGYLDPTFYRDDFRRRDVPVQARETQMPFSVEGKRVILVDDVLFTGRTVRAAMDAIVDFGRPAKIELLVLVDRKYRRDLPVAANYVGRYVNTMESQKIQVELQAREHQDNKIWLVSYS